MKPWIIVALRTILLFFLSLVIVRIMGSNNISKSSPFKFINYVVISILITIVSLGIIPNNAFIVLGIWVLFSLVIDYLSLKVKWIHDLVKGTEIVLIKDGKILEDNVKKVRYTAGDLIMELRGKGAFNLSDVQFAVMESNGEVNVLLKSDKKPLTSHDLQRKVAPLSEPETVIMDGKIVDGALSNRGLNREWLRVQLDNMGVLLNNVFVGQVDSSGDLFIDIYDDSKEIIQPKVKELLYANISKVQADLLAFSLQTENSQMKKMYSNNANTVKRMMDKLEPYLLR